MQAEESISKKRKMRNRRETRKFNVIDNFYDIAKNALKNPVVLNRVFHFLDTESIRAVRLVCLDWAEVATPFLGKQGRLTFSTEAHSDLPESPKSYRKKLMKEITLYMDCTCGLTESCHCSVNGIEVNHRLASKFSQLWCESRHKRLITLKFDIRKTFNPCLHEILRTYHFQNLTKVTIIAKKVSLDKADADNDLAPEIRDLAEFQFQPLEKLKSLNFWIVYTYEVHFSGSYLSSLCQGLLNAAPNLESFDVTANFYPDLTPCRKLNDLDFAFVECRDFCTKVVVPLDASEMTRMLESCRDSVKKLKLNYYVRDKNVKPGPSKLDFRLPNLTHLTIEAAHVYKIEDSLNTTNLPKLTELSLNSSGFHDGDISTMMGTYHMQHAGITTLHVGCTHHTENGEQLAVLLSTIFPAVKEFKLKLRVRLVDNVSGQDFRSLKENMEALDGWELMSGEVDVQFVGGEITTGEDLYEVFVAKVMISMLQGMKGWTSLPKTTLRFFCYRSSTEFKLSEEMRDTFLACGTIGKLDIEGFQMTPEDGKSFDAFIKENKLKVRRNNRKWI